jgi:hypothetical protein
MQKIKGFRDNRQFFAQNWQKTPKIVILTSGNCGHFSLKKNKDVILFLHNLAVLWSKTTHFTLKLFGENEQNRNISICIW